MEVSVAGRYSRRHSLGERTCFSGLFRRRVRELMSATGLGMSAGIIRACAGVSRQAVETRNQFNSFTRSRTRLVFRASLRVQVVVNTGRGYSPPLLRGGSMQPRVSHCERTIVLGFERLALPQHPRLRLNLPQPVSHGRNPAEVFQNVLLAYEPDWQHPAG